MRIGWHFSVLRPESYGSEGSLWPISEKGLAYKRARGYILGSEVCVEEPQRVIEESHG